MQHLKFFPSQSIYLKNARPNTQKNDISFYAKRMPPMKNLLCNKEPSYFKLINKIYDQLKILQQKTTQNPTATKVLQRGFQIVDQYYLYSEAALIAIYELVKKEIDESISTDAKPLMLIKCKTPLSTHRQIKIIRKPTNNNSARQIARIHYKESHISVRKIPVLNISKNCKMVLRVSPFLSPSKNKSVANLTPSTGYAYKARKPSRTVIRNMKMESPKSGRWSNAIDDEFEDFVDYSKKLVEYRNTSLRPNEAND